MDPALQAMLVTPIQHAAYVGMDSYGKPSYGAPQTQFGKLEFRHRRIVDMTGQERLSRARVFLDGTVSLDLKDQVILPDGTAPPLVALYEVFDVDGSRSHWEAAF